MFVLYILYLFVIIAIKKLWYEKEDLMEEDQINK